MINWIRNKLSYYQNNKLMSKADYDGKEQNMISWHTYGHGGVAPKDSLGISLCINDDNNNKAVFLNTYDGIPIGFNEWETWTANYKTGSIITLLNDGSINILSTGKVNINGASDVNINSGGNVNINAAKVNINASELDVSGTIKCSNISTSTGFNFNDHIHIGDNGGNTSPPIS